MVSDGKIIFFLFKTCGSNKEGWYFGDREKKGYQRRSSEVRQCTIHINRRIEEIREWKRFGWTYTRHRCVHLQSWMNVRNNRGGRVFLFFFSKERNEVRLIAAVTTAFSTPKKGSPTQDNTSHARTFYLFFSHRAISRPFHFVFFPFACRLHFRVVSGHFHVILMKIVMSI